MDDLISRQAAIDAIKTWGLIDGLSEGQAIEILADEEKLPSAQPKTDEENELKFYYVESIDDYWIGQRLDNFYYADWHECLGFVWSKSRYLPWGEHIVNENTLWKEHTYPSEPIEIPFTEWIVGFMKKYSAEPKTGEWIPCSERLPRYDDTSEYLVTDKDGRIRHCCLDPYMPETFVTVEEGMMVDAVAWRPAPEPYCKTESHEREVE